MKKVFGMETVNSVKIEVMKLEKTVLELKAEKLRLEIAILKSRIIPK